jgi:hypothetical protein
MMLHRNVASNNKIQLKVTSFALWCAGRCASSWLYPSSLPVYTVFKLFTIVICVPCCQTLHLQGFCE